MPTEAEWEYATRAGTTTPTYWNEPSKQCQFVNSGDQATKTVDLSGYNTHALDADCNDGYPTTSPVGAFPPNPWGLYDMLGNVGQWTEDCGTSYSLKGL
ncbi:formylglycine-generating enzyme family protein [Collimonas fungivorans]|uniref:formylglycine-generating enzyme family protein n=1 Tax=Collimonas fungivorans TaxID=158899 RepID=UPI0009DAD51A